MIHIIKLNQKVKKIIKIYYINNKKIMILKQKCIKLRINNNQMIFK